MGKTDIPGTILRSMDSGQGARIRGDAVVILFVWVAADFSLMMQAPSLMVGVIEAVVGLAPFAIGGVFWWRHRASALAEARRVRSPLELP